MKKLIAIILMIAILCLSFAACAETPAPDADDTSASADTTTTNGDGTTPDNGDDPEPPVQEDPYTRDGNFIEFGTWPQTNVSDSELLATLNGKYDALPSNGNDGSWTSYGYYKGTASGDAATIHNGSQSNDESYMWYIDIDLDDNGSKDYRGVYFTSVRPTHTSSAPNQQKINGYEVETVYWFKWEPLKWRILSEGNTDALIFCEMLIDSQAFQNCSKSVNENFYATDDSGNIISEAGNNAYANNYAQSTIRKWLAETFYDQAFSDIQKAIIQSTTLDNSLASTGDTTNSYVCADTEDKIFLLSQKDISSSQYGFASYNVADTVRQKKITDYARNQGASTSNEGYGYWMLRSPANGNGAIIKAITDAGNANFSYHTNYIHFGVCPALWITLQ